MYREGITLDQGTVYAIGHLVLLFNSKSKPKFSDIPEQISSLLKMANKISIANPELAPYGAAASQYLQNRHLWDVAKSKIVFGENISIATMYVSSGAVDVGFTSLSLAKSMEVAKTTQYVHLNGADTLVSQRMVLMKGAPKIVLSLYEYLKSPAAKSILIKHGYSIP